MMPRTVLAEPATAGHLLRDLLRIAVNRKVWWAEFWSCVATLTWGALLSRYDGELKNYPVFALVLTMWPVYFWAFLSVGLGTWQLVSLLLDRKELRWSASVLLCSLWGVLTSAVWTVLPPVAVPFGALCGINLYSVLRLPFKR